MLTQEQYEQAMQELRSLDRMPAAPAEERRLVRDYEQRQGEQPEVIRRFNELNSVHDLLLEAGYTPDRTGKKYLSPDSSSGNHGVSILTGDDGRELVFSHHGDVLGDGRAHDAFDVLALLHFDGDKKEATRHAKKELGLWQENTPDKRRSADAPAKQVQAAAQSVKAPQKGNINLYIEKNGAHYLRKQYDGGTVETPLCNFLARIIAEKERDDGAESTLSFVISGSLADGRPLPEREVTPAKFAGGNWFIEEWGSVVVPRAGQGTKEHLRIAIQERSGNVPRLTAYAHLGFRKVSGQWVYLHAGGALGASAPLIKLFQS